MLCNNFSVITDWEPVYSYKKGIELYEIHTDVMEVDVSEKADYRKYFSNIWNHVHIKEGCTYELELEYHFIYILVHIAKHIKGSGAGIRMYLDIAIFIHKLRDKVDWKYVENELEKIQLTDFANFVLYIVKTAFGVESPIPLKKIDKNLLKEFIDFTLSGGIFGRENMNSGMNTLKKEELQKGVFSKIKVIFERIFVPASTIEKRYTYLKGHHWLLPFAWVHRLIKTRESFSLHAMEAKNILDADTEKIISIREM